MLEVRDLTKRFGSKAAVDRLSFSAESGRVTGLVGPNGAGKTTTLRCLLGLSRPDAGSCTFDRVPYAALEHPPRHVGALLAAATTGHPGRSARDHLRVVAAAGHIPSERVDTVLGSVGLLDVAQHRLRTFSLGMRQRLGLAAALLGEPRTLLLDEPVNGLDPEGVRWLRTLLRELAAEGRTVLVASHLLSELSRTVDDLIVIGRGQLVAAGTAEDIIDAGRGGTVIVRADDADRLTELLRGAGARVDRHDSSVDGARSAFDDALEVTGLSAERIGRIACHAGISLAELTPQRRSLEDAFLELTAELARFDGTDP